MLDDDATLPEPTNESLVRAGFATDETSAALIDAALGAPVARHRILALRAAARRTLLDAPRWRRALSDEDPLVRREAATLAARESGGALDEALTSALEDDDPLVVEAAAHALGEHEHAEAVEALCRVAREHDDARCRESAVAALGVLGDERGRSTVIAALEDKAPVRRRAVVALANFEGPDVEAALARAREDRNWQVRAAVGQLESD